MYEAYTAVAHLPRTGLVLDYAVAFLHYEYGAEAGKQVPAWLEGWHPYDAQEPQ